MRFRDCESGDGFRVAGVRYGRVVFASITGGGDSSRKWALRLNLSYAYVRRPRARERSAAFLTDTEIEARMSAHIHIALEREVRQ